MAVKWAVANGNWNAGATWNDGTIPQVGDYVYASGKTIQIPSSVNIGNGTLSTEICPNTGIGGGRFNSGDTSLNITANLKGYNGVYVVWSVQGLLSGNVAITGNIDDYGISLQGGTAYTLSITGNVSGSFYQSRYGANITKTVNIVGNINAGAQIQTNTDSFIINVTGNVYENLICNNLARISKLNVDGHLYVKGNNIITYHLTINGVIDTTQSTVNYFPITSTITFSAPSIIKQTEIDYPRPEDVKINVVYADGQMVGTYDINQLLPPESVVLKDFVYDNGDKTGVLETTNLSQQLISRLENCATIETVQQLLVAHLDN